jgi:hypothetical protein
MTYRYDDNYTHILNIKILCLKTDSIIQNKSLNEIIEYHFIEGEKYLHFENWHKIQWHNYNEYFELGNLVTETKFTDKVLYSNVKSHLKDLELDLKKNNLLLHHHKLIFKLIRPLNESTTIENNYGLTDQQIYDSTNQIISEDSEDQILKNVI